MDHNQRQPAAVIRGWVATTRRVEVISPDTLVRPPGLNCEPFGAPPRSASKNDYTGAPEAPHSTGNTSHLPRCARIAAVVAPSGIPLHIHLPAFLASRYSIASEPRSSLPPLPWLLDFTQDPGLGGLLSRIGRYRETAVLKAGSLLGGGLIELFAMSAPIAPLVRVAACLTLTFTGFSMFCAHQSRSGGDRAVTFGFWILVGKAVLAITAGLVLPVLARTGFAPSGPHEPATPQALTAFYALVPCGLKAAALAFLFLAVRGDIPAANAIQ